MSAGTNNMEPRSHSARSRMASRFSGSSTAPETSNVCFVRTPISPRLWHTHGFRCGRDHDPSLLPCDWPRSSFLMTGNWLANMRIASRNHLVQSISREKSFALDRGSETVPSVACPDPDGQGAGNESQEVREIGQSPAGTFGSNRCLSLSNVFTSNTLGKPVRTTFCRWRIGRDKKEQKSKRKSNADKNDGNKHVWKPRRWRRRRTLHS